VVVGRVAFLQGDKRKQTRYPFNNIRSIQKNDDYTLSLTSCAHIKIQNAFKYKPEPLTSRDMALLKQAFSKQLFPLLSREPIIASGMSIKPETILEQSLDKQRIVITGSRGRTSLTAILIHVLNYYKRSFDYVLSTPVHGIRETSRISSAPIIIIEGDESTMLSYKHHIGLISNIIWTKTDEFPSEEDYVKLFDIFADNLPKAGLLFYCENDPIAFVVGAKPRTDVLSTGYKIHPHTSEAGKHFLTTAGKEKIPVNIYGSVNFQNISGAKELLKRIGVTADQFYQAISTFPL